MDLRCTRGLSYFVCKAFGPLRTIARSMYTYINVTHHANERKVVFRLISDLQSQSFLPAFARVNQETCL